MEREEKGWTENLYWENLPEEIVKELTPEMRRQYFLWDEIMKREIDLYPWLVLPVVKEIFHREYPEKSQIMLLSTEYIVSRIHEEGEKLLHAIRSDLLLRIERDLYHFECQIEKSGEMVFRMLEYDIHIGLTHGKNVAGSRDGLLGAWVTFPKSAVLYLGDEKNVPAYEACTLYFQDGTEHVYQIPVMKVQEYSPEKIEERHLDLLIPFLPVRFRRQISRMAEKREKADKAARAGGAAQADKTAQAYEAAREGVKKDLTEFLLKCRGILAREREQEFISEDARKDIWEFLWKVCGYLLEKNAGLYEEVSAEVEPAIKLTREIMAELQDSNKELQDSNKELQQKLENACRRIITDAAKDGRGREEAEDILMNVLSLTREEAEEKVRSYWKEPLHTA